ncbi:MAG: thioredoxin family protein [Fidelibacterota bacterium]
MINKYFVIIGLAATLLMAGSNDLFVKHSLDEALSIGIAEGKGVLVKFHADWCHFCNKMDRVTFADPGVQKAMEGYISIKVDIETKEGLALARKFGVTGLPTIVMFDKNGKKIYHQPGFHSAKQMEKVLNTRHG